MKILGDNMWKCQLCGQSIWRHMIVVGFTGAYYKFHRRCIGNTTEEKLIVALRLNE